MNMGGSMLKEPENVLNHGCGDEICCLSTAKMHCLALSKGISMDFLMLSF